MLELSTKIITSLMVEQQDRLLKFTSDYLETKLIFQSRNK